LEISFLAPQCRDTQDLVLSATLNGEEIDSSSLHIIGETKNNFAHLQKQRKEKKIILKPLSNLARFIVSIGVNARILENDEKKNT